MVAENSGHINANSAVRLVKKVEKKQIDTKDLPSAVLPDLIGFRNKIWKILENEDFSLDGQHEELIDGLFDFGTFLQHCCQRLDRTCLVSLQFLWQRMEPFRQLLSHFSQWHQLRPTVEVVDSVWMVESSAANVYSLVYKNLAPVRPFSSDEKLQISSEIVLMRRMEATIGDGVQQDTTLRKQRLALHEICSSCSGWEDQTLQSVLHLREGLKQLSCSSSVKPEWFCLVELLGCSVARNHLAMESCSKSAMELEIFCLQNSSLFPLDLLLGKTLDWERNRELFLWLMWLNSGGYPVQLDERLGFRFRNVHLSTHSVLTECSVSFGTEMNWSWEIGNFSLSAAERIKVYAEQLCGALWSQGVQFGLVGGQIRRGIETVQDIFQKQLLLVLKNEEVCEELHGDLDMELFFVKFGLLLCQLSIPPKGLLDPVEKKTAEKRIIELQLNEVESELRVIRRFHYLLTNSENFVEKGSVHPHPYMSALIRRHDRLKQELANMDDSASNYVRSSQYSFERLAVELNGFFQLTSNAMAAVLEEPKDERKKLVSGAVQKLSKMQGWLLSSERFTASLFTDFMGLPDVFSTFMLGVLLVQTGANLISADLARHIQTAEKNCISPVRAYAINNLQPLSVRDDCDIDLWNFWLEANSPLPLELQLSHFLHCANSVTNFEVAFSWLQRQWRRMKAQKQSEEEESNTVSYEYRARKRRRGEEAEDTDSQEMRMRFPDFRETDSSDTVGINSDSPAVLLPSEIVLAMRTLLDTLRETENGNWKENWTVDYWTSLWCAQQLRGATETKEGSNSAGLHLLSFSKLVQKWTEEKSSENNDKINVYKESSVASLLACRDLITELKRATEGLKKDWPDMAALPQIERSADRIMELRMNSPLMKLATSVERLLDDCQEWESVASRSVSLEPWIEPLRSLLVEWRKMEVRCWERILDDLEIERADEAIEAGMTLLDTCFQASLEKTSFEVAIGMAVEWMKSSQIGDFQARLEIMELCQRCVKKPLSDQLRSLRTFYELSKDAVTKQRTADRNLIQAELKNFVKVAKFQDLNLWKMKQTVQKAHRQLFSYVKKYKEALSQSAVPQLRDPVSLDFLDKGIVKEGAKEFVSDRSSSSAKQLSARSKEMVSSVASLNWSEALDECRELVESTASALKKAVKYSGSTGEENMKQQKRTLVSRKVEIGEILRILRDMGFHPRRGLCINSDKLGFDLMFRVAGECESLVKGLQVCATWRQAFLTAAEKPNDQIGPHLVQKFRGLTELIPSVMHGRASEFDQFWNELKRFDQLLAHLDSALSDLSEGYSLLNQNLWDEFLDNILKNAARLEQLLNETKEIWSCCPDKSYSDPWTLTALQNCSPKVSTYWSESEEYCSKMNQLLKTVETVAGIRKHLFTIRSRSGGYILIKEIDIILHEIGRFSDVRSSVQMLIGVGECDDSPCFFDSALRKASSLLEECLLKCTAFCELRKRPPVPSHVSSGLNKGIRSMKLAVQRAMKTIRAKNCSVHGTPEYLQLLSALATTTQFSKVGEHLKDVLKEFRKGVDCSAVGRLADFLECAKTFRDMYQWIVISGLADLNCLIHLYVPLMDTFIKLVKDGFVEPVPETEEGGDPSGVSQFQDKEQAGLGDGVGSKDVTDEIEDTSQIEDSKGNEEKTELEEQQAETEDVEKPIEMEEDFGGQLEDLNLDGDESSESDEGEEDGEPDWNMGDAEAPEEEQLDPNMWENEDNEGELDDENDGGQNKLTEELAAKDEDANSTEQDQGMQNEHESEKDLEEQDQFENINEADIEDLSGEESDTDGVDMEQEEETGQLPQDHTGVEEPDISEEATEDLSEMTAISQSQSGAGDASEEANEAVRCELVEGPDTKGDEKGARDESGGNERNITPVDINAEDDDHGRSRGGMDEGNVGKQKQMKHKSTDKTLGLPDRDWKDNATLDDTRNSGDDSSDLKTRDSRVWSHAPDLSDDATQVLDSGTLEEAQSQKLGEVDANKEDVTEGLNQEAEKNDAEELEGGTNVSGEQDLTDEDVKEVEEGSDEVSVQEEVEHRSSIHTVLDFYNHASRSLRYEDLPHFPTVEDGAFGENSRFLWAKYQAVTAPLAAELSENLRLTLEPTQASKMEGDFRSGKRLNIRKLIPYVASSYRKNKIWLRRTKRAKRNYQVLIAVDDSSSMQDNKTRQLAYESLALLGLALRYLEVGQMGICKFGEEPEMLHQFSSNFSDDCGASVIGRLNFNQQKTNVNKLLEFAVSSFLSVPGGSRDSSVPAQLLLIVSDGRGLFVEGIETVQRAVQLALGAKIFVVFIVLDSPEHKDSILDIKVPVFGKEGSLSVIRTYMDFFPFPFYVILREVSALPAIVGDALRQWFEIVAQRS